LWDSVEQATTRHRNTHCISRNNRPRSYLSCLSLHQDVLKENAEDTLLGWKIEKTSSLLSIGCKYRKFLDAYKHTILDFRLAERT